jgi:type IV secretion system protein VirB10
MVTAERFALSAASVARLVSLRAAAPYCLDLLTGPSGYTCHRNGSRSAVADLIMPNGRSIVFERQPGADTGGYAGLRDEVDHHWTELSRAALLSTLLGVGAEFGSGSDTGNGSSAIFQALRRGAGDSLNQTSQQIVRRNLNIQPTLTIRPGFPVRVIVNRDLVLEPYRG